MRIPSMIILRMPDRVAALQRLWRDHGMMEEYLLERHTDEVLDNILACLDRSNLAPSALMTFAASRAYFASQYNSDDFAAKNAALIHELGQEFFSLFIEHQLYLNGRMDYVYSGRCSNKEIILTHFK